MVDLAVRTNFSTSIKILFFKFSREKVSYFETTKKHFFFFKKKLKIYTFEMNPVESRILLLEALAVYNVDITFAASFGINFGRFRSIQFTD